MIYAYSKKLDNTQMNYSVTDKELLAVVKATGFFRRYLIGRCFKLRTDHKAIKFIKKAKDQNTRLLRWSLKLQEFHYEVEYIEGDKNGADGLSRAVSTKPTVNNINKEIQSDQKKDTREHSFSTRSWDSKRHEVFHK